MTQSFLRLVGLTKRYGGKTVVDCVSLEVAEGEFLALLGSSGCGKTTTLRLIAGLETPDSGEVWIAGECVAANGRTIVPPSARHIGFVFQDLALWPHLTIKGNLNFVLAAAGVPKSQRPPRIADVLRLAHVERFADSYPSELSGGEQQRAAIARAVVGRPRLLLLDEPLSNLDVSLKAELLKELGALQQSLGITTIYVTHALAEAAAVSHRLGVMDGGRIQQTGSILELKTRPANEAVERIVRQDLEGPNVVEC